MAKKVEAYGVRGMRSTPWRLTFRSLDAMWRWVETHDAVVNGWREVEG